MKKLILIGLFTLSGIISAHDEGHGPKLSDTPKLGGKVGPVIAASEATKGSSAALLYKAELVRSSEDDSMKVYVYDKDMNALPEAQLSKFGTAAVGTVEHVKKGKVARTSRFNLELKDGSFVGKLSERPKTPTFNVDVKIKEGDKELLAAFDNLETKQQ